MASGLIGDTLAADRFTNHSSSRWVDCCLQFFKRISSNAPPARYFNRVAGSLQKQLCKTGTDLLALFFITDARWQVFPGNVCSDDQLRFSKSEPFAAVHCVMLREHSPNCNSHLLPSPRPAKIVSRSFYSVFSFAKHSHLSTWPPRRRLVRPWFSGQHPHIWPTIPDCIFSADCPRPSFQSDQFDYGLHAGIEHTLKQSAPRV